MGLGHGMQHWECRPYQVLTNEKFWLTYTYFAMATICPYMVKHLNIFLNLNVNDPGAWLVALGCSVCSSYLNISACNIIEP